MKYRRASSGPHKTKRQSGYTMFEVIIFLAISTVILSSAITLFKGQNNETAFDQSVYDVNSALSLRIKNVSTTVFSDTENYKCTINGGKPTLTAVATGQGSNEDCLYLGKAIEPIIGSSDFYVYTVLGSRCYGSPCTTVTSFSNASPTPIVSNTGGIDLTEKYNAGGSIKVVSSSVKLVGGISPITGYNLIGYYNDISGSSAVGQSGSEHILAKGYNYNRPHEDNTTAKTAIEDTAVADISLWSLCLSDTGGGKSATIDVESTVTGIKTSISFKACS